MGMSHNAHCRTHWNERPSYCHLLFCFKINFFQKLKVWIKIRPDVLLGMSRVRTVGKGYQQTTLVGKDLKATFRLSQLFELRQAFRLSNLFSRYIFSQLTRQKDSKVMQNLYKGTIDRDCPPWGLRVRYVV